MKFKIHRTWNGNLLKYMDQLSNFNFKIVRERSYSDYIYLGEIELTTTEDIVLLINSINCKIIFKNENEIEIYDDYRE